jgi:meso-butanediol dehydrogenase / (S,S)-butanediol dehydrogenase / diacetyl reductase
VAPRLLFWPPSRVGQPQRPPHRPRRPSAGMFGGSDDQGPVGLRMETAALGPWFSSRYNIEKEATSIEVDVHRGRHAHTPALSLRPYHAIRSRLVPRIELQLCSFAFFSWTHPSATLASGAWCIRWGLARPHDTVALPRHATFGPDEKTSVGMGSNMPRDLSGKVALITGTGGGQGRAAALRFAEAGALVIGCDVKVEGDQETARLVHAVGGSMVSMDPVDLGDPIQAEKWVEDAARVHGRIDILYNNAAATKMVAFETFSISDWQFGIRNELDLVFYVTRFAWPHLSKHGGVIINTASIAGLIGSGPGGAVHAAAKGAILALTTQLAWEGAPRGIRVLAISPGIIETPATAPRLEDQDARARLLAKNLIKRIGQPDDVAKTAVFLASEDASYMTGTNIIVDGGFMASWD